MDNTIHNESLQGVSNPPPKPFFESLKSDLKEIFFPDDPFRQFKNQPASKRLLLGFKYFVPFLEWAPQYNFKFFIADLVAGITIASLAVPQGISYANLANLPPIIGLYSSFIPPIIYAMFGSSRDLAIGSTAILSLFMSSTVGKEVSPTEDPKHYVQLVFTVTFFAGVFQAAFGFFRLGFVVDFLSEAALEGFMSGGATVICLQELKGLLGLKHITNKTDIISVAHSILSQKHQWRWETAVFGCCFILFLTFIKEFSKRKPKFFWVNVIAPLVSIIIGSLLVYLIHAEKHGIPVIGHLDKGLNPLSVSALDFQSPHLMAAIKIALTISVVALSKSIPVGRYFATRKKYSLDGNKEMIALGLMNVVGSCTSCFLASGPFSKTAVNSNAGCKTAMSNIFMAITIMLTLLFLTPLFYYTPLVVLSALIITATIGLIDFPAAIHIWEVDRFDFLVCISTYISVVFGSIEIGLITAISISILRLVLRVSRPRTCVLGKIARSKAFRNIHQYPDAKPVPGVLILQIDSPIFFSNASYLKDRISRWIDEEEDGAKHLGESRLRYLILDMGSVGSIDSNGLKMLEEVQRDVEKRDLKLLLANPQSEVISKLYKSKFVQTSGTQCMYPSVGEAVEHGCKSTPVALEDFAPVDTV